MPQTKTKPKLSALEVALRSSSAIGVTECRAQTLATLLDWHEQVTMIIASRGEHVPKYLKLTRARIRAEIERRAG